jgi:hypothetical protein
MRPQLPLRASAALTAAGALSYAMILATGAPAVVKADTPGVQAAVRDASVAYGQTVVVTGRLADAQAGTPVRLEFAPPGGTSFRTVNTGETRAGGGFRLTAGLRRSGVVRVASGAPAARAADTASATEVASAPQRVRVGAGIVTRLVRTQVLGGRPVLVRGALRPGGAGRTVALQLRGHGGWRTVDRAHTGRGGRFALHYRAHRSSAARVRFGGDSTNGSARRSLPRVAVFRRAVASWYGPGLYGNRLGCGGTLTPGTLGVANKSLPCGTPITLRYRGRSVRVRVVDRGPFVAGREFDLTAATKRRLGFGSVGTIWVAV